MKTSTTPTQLQTITLSRLKNEFGVDVSLAAGLLGPALDAWLRDAEDSLFDRQMQERRDVLAQGGQK